MTTDPAYRRISDLVREHAQARPDHAALVQGDERLDYAALDALMDRIAAALQRDGLRPGDVISICARSSPRHAAVFLGALRAGVVVAPLAPSVTPESLASMRGDAGAGGCLPTRRRSTRWRAPAATPTASRSTASRPV